MSTPRSPHTTGIVVDEGEQVTLTSLGVGLEIPASTIRSTRSIRPTAAK